MLLRAAAVLPMTGPEPPVLRNAAVRVEGNRITAVGTDLPPLPGEEVRDLGHSVLLPGLINAHCHLDYTHFKGALFPGRSFTEWIKAINALKQACSPDDYLAAIRDGWTQLLASGCTTVFNIAAFPDLLLRLPRPPLRIWWFLELIDIRTRIHSDETLLGAMRFFEDHPDWLGGFGLSPHAPYTASVELYRLARHCSEAYRMPSTTHIAESRDEQEMFLHGGGGLFDFLRTLGRPMDDCGQGSALSHLLEYGLLDERCLAVHLNYLQEYDWPLLRARPLSVVHCPLCHRYFGHRRFPLEQLRDAGCRILLGTDSLASNHILDLRAEIRQVRTLYPGVPACDWLSMATRGAGAAIGLPGTLGVLQPGALADLVAFPLHDSDPFAAVIHATEPPVLILIDGKPPVLP